MANHIDFAAGDLVAAQKDADKESREAHEMSVLMGFDAMRLCMNLPTKNYTHEEVIRWMNCVRKERELQRLAPAHPGSQSNG